MTTANIDLGKIRFTWRGAFVPATQYVRDEVVRYQGRAWICVIDDEATTIETPSEAATDWHLMVDGGDVATVMVDKGDLLVRGFNGFERIAHPSSDPTGKVLRSYPSGGVDWDAPVGAIVNQVRRQYNGGQWHASTTYTDLPGSSWDYTPVRSDTVIHYRYNFYASWWWDAHGIQHYRMYHNDAEQFRFTKAGYYDESFCAPEFWIPSWGTDTRNFKIQTRAYTNNQHEQYHFSTHYFDGGPSSQNVTTNWLTITEYLMP